MKKNILIAAYNLDFGGIEVSLINLLKNMDYKKYDITLILERKEGIFLSDIPKNVKIKEYKVCNNKNVLVRKIINFCKQLKWKFLNKNKYDASISYATYSKPCSFLARTASKNTILFIHSNYCHAYNNDEIRIRNFFNGIKLMSFKNIVFVSNEAKDSLCKLYDINGRSVVINNLIDYKAIIEKSKEKVEIPKSKGKVFSYIGRLDESSKRVSIILKVAKKCKDENKNVSFWIIGDGPNRDEYLKFKNDNKLNNVIFFGAKENPYPYLKNSDYLILTSRYEGFPVVYNEAILLGKYILSTINVSDDYITIPNRFGIITKDDVESIYKNMLHLLENDVTIKEKIDFAKINKARVEKLEKLLEGENG